MVHCCCFHDANQSVMRASRSLSVLSFARPPARTLAAAARAPTRAHTQNEPSQKSKRAPRSASRCGAIVTSREDANARDACASTRRTCAHQTPPFALTGVLSTRPTRAATHSRTRSIAKFFFVVSISAGRTRSERARRGFAARASTPWIWFNSAHNARRAARTPRAPARSVRRARDAIARLRRGDAQCAPAARQRTPFQRAPLSQIARHIAFERRTAQNHFWCTKSVRTSQVNASEESILTCDIEFFT